MEELEMQNRWLRHKAMLRGGSDARSVYSKKSSAARSSSGESKRSKLSKKKERSRSQDVSGLHGSSASVIYTTAAPSYQYQMQQPQQQVLYTTSSTGPASYSYSYSQTQPSVIGTSSVIGNRQPVRVITRPG